jgi:hypothetical protein
MDGTVKTLDRNVVSGFEKLGTKVDGLVDLFTDLQADNRERDAKLADSLRTLAERLGTPAHSTPPFSPPTRRQQRVQSPSPDGDNQPSADAARGHRMVPKHHSIQSFWNEWYGLEDCKDKPVVGGIAAMERQHKSKWRKHFSPSETKHFSRSQIVIQSINTACDASGERMEKTIEAFKEVYEVRIKLSMAKMAIIVQELGLVTKKNTEAKQSNLTRHAHYSCIIY